MKGDKITFSSNRNGSFDVFARSADVTGEAEPLLATPRNEYGYEWSSDGKYLVGSGEGKIWYLQAKEGASGYEKVMFLDTPFNAVSPDLSPDAKFLAYESNESGQYEVYVQPLPQGGGKRPVSTNGGHQPRWRGDGKEIFYVEEDMLVAVSKCARAKKWDCHQFPFLQSISKSALRRKEIGWLSPFFASSDLRHGLLSL